MVMQVKDLSLKHSCVTPNFGLHPWCAPALPHALVHAAANVDGCNECVAKILYA